MNNLLRGRKRGKVDSILEIEKKADLGGCPKVRGTVVKVFMRTSFP